ncbi:solute carrier family 2, facilitated glucose transporter member 10-like isoform X2 [Antedon mediterranea]|uniref:solute carrier family 2, facilitated glucose transporter member 10-like isoform X2 n=1 Tax=Antedon mediterranea TaxID=105859 RepID=UPI003AF88F98
MDVNLLSSEYIMEDDYRENINGFSEHNFDIQEDCEEMNPVHKPRKSKMTPHLLLATLMAALGGVLFGYDIGIIAGAMLQLREEFSLSDLQQEVVISAMLLGAVFGSLLGGFIIDSFGRRYSLILNSFVFTAGGVILTCATSFTALNIGRVIVGFAVSLSAIGECIYISEVSPSDRRGQLVSLNELGITIGILLAYLINYFFISVENGWRFMFGISIIPAIIQGCGMVILPSSPRYLIKRGKVEEAVRVLKLLRGEHDVSDEINGMKAGLAIEDGYSLADLFKPKANMRIRMVIGGGLVFLQQITGQTNVVYYAPTVLQGIGFESNVAASTATVGIGFTKFLSTALCLLIVDYIGRRKLLLSGVTCMMFSIVILGVTTKISHKTETLNSTIIDIDTDINVTSTPFESTDMTSLYQSSNLTWDESSDSNTAAKVISLVSLMMFVSAYAFSFGPVTWLLLTEIYPLGVRGRATSLATTLNWGTNMVLSLTFLNLMNAIGIATLFLVYGAFCLVAILFIYVAVPETKNKTLEEISKDLSERKFSNSRRREPVSLPTRIRGLQLPVNAQRYTSMPSEEC